MSLNLIPNDIVEHYDNVIEKCYKHIYCINLLCLSMSILQAAIFRNTAEVYPTVTKIIKPALILKNKKTVIKIDFILCESCFWCASQSNKWNGSRRSITIITKCPSCNSNRIESMPISHEEDYTFNHDLKRGVTLGFSKIRSHM
jgi:predicted Zn-ribbon and HTH transcriptional regulator